MTLEAAHAAARAVWGIDAPAPRPGKSEGVWVWKVAPAMDTEGPDVWMALGAMYAPWDPERLRAPVWLASLATRVTGEILTGDPAWSARDALHNLREAAITVGIAAEAGEVIHEPEDLAMMRDFIDGLWGSQ